jgi:FkbM family methyltransferase
MPDFLSELIKPDRLVSVVDVGANPIDGAPPYRPLLSEGLCTVVGFEPQPDALNALNAVKGPNETYLPYVVGNGQPGILRVCSNGGMSSLFRPDINIASYFRGFESWGRVVQELEIQTRRLDDISEIEQLDFLKIDAQGAELDVFMFGERKLAGAVAIQTEVSFVPLYEQQPTFGQIDIELRRQGFLTHSFPAVKNWMIAPTAVEGNPYAALNQVLEADVVYVRDFTKPQLMTDEQLKHLALIAHHCFGSFDLTVNCLHRLQERAAVSTDAVARYMRAGRAR